jgi:hypothetical protein
MQFSKSLFLGTLIAGSLLVSGASGASSAAWGHGWHGRAPGEIRRDRAEIERDRRELNRSEHRLRRELHQGNPMEIARARREVWRDRRELRESYGELHRDRHKYPWWRPNGWRNWHSHWW